MRSRIALGARLFGVSVLIFVTLVFSSRLALAQVQVFQQGGPKLVGSGAVGPNADSGECGQ
jgi:hypothetical protein